MEGNDKKDVILNIYCPKGTKGIYAEPFSTVGNGYGIYWDGISTQETIGREAELILQRGTKFRIIRIYKGEMRGEDKWFADVEVAGL